MKQDPELSIIVPVFNEAECIWQSNRRLVSVISAQIKCKAEIIYVDDGSSDGTDQILRELSFESQDPNIHIHVLRFSRNFGHSAAVFAGIDVCQGEIVAIIDADMQDPPEILPAMLSKLAEGWDVVYGKRVSRESESFSKKLTAYFFYRLINWLSGIEIPKDTGDFRVMNRKVVEALRLIKEQDPFMRGLVAWVGFRQFAFEYQRKPRVAGQTKYPFRKMMSFALKAIVSFSNFPLFIAVVIGGIGFFGCVGLSIWVIWAWAKGITVPGWASLMISFGFFQSATLVVIGIVGAYVGRVFQEAKNRPRYIVSDRF